MSRLCFICFFFACFLGYCQCAFVIGDEVWTDKGTTLNLKYIQNTKTNERVLVHLLGGRVEAIELSNGETVQNLILGHNKNVTAVIENKYWRGAILVPFANRIADGTYTWNGQKLQLPINDGNGLHNALHGFLWKTPMTVLSENPGTDSGSLTLTHTFSKTDEVGYPFDLKVTITYRLDQVGFFVTVSATNMMQQGSLPFYHGFHPYFICDCSKSYVVLDKCMKWERLVVNSELIPTGQTVPFYLFNGTDPIGYNSNTGYPNFWDSEFRGLGSVVDCPRVATEIRLYQKDNLIKPTTVILEQDEQFRFVHVYTGSLEASGQDALTVEPMSAEANAYNNFVDLHILDPNQEWKGTFGIYVRK